jgi:hypothetical protein
LIQPCRTIVRVPILEPTHVRGTITAVGFASGHRFLVGDWRESPLGRTIDVMRVDPDGRRHLLVPDQTSAEFITSIYVFDEVHVGPLDVHGDGRSTHVVGHGLELSAHAGRLRPVPFPRPRWLTRYVEAPIARRLMGVHTYGTSPTGAREWYQTRGWRWVTEASITVDGVSPGALAAVERPVGVGFTDPPLRPSIVEVRVAIHPPA